MQRLLLVLGSLLVMLIALECVLRGIAHRPTPSPIGDRSPFFYVPDEDRDHPWSRGATNVLRIAVIGDSFTVGEGVQGDDRYANRLERLLNMQSKKPPVNVRVFAECGTSTFQQVALLDEALKWNPRIVVLGICLNDMEDWANPKELLRWREGLFPNTPPRWLARVFQCSRALDWMYHRLQAAQMEREELRYYRRLYKPSYRGVSRFRESIKTMNDKCVDAHVVFVPMIWPLLSEKFQAGCYPFEYAHEAIRQRCEELKVPCLDLLPFFRDASPDRLQVIPGIDPHPNEIAHRMAAETLMLFLLDKRYISKGYRPDQQESACSQHGLWEQIMERINGAAGAWHKPSTK